VITEDRCRFQGRGHDRSSRDHRHDGGPNAEALVKFHGSFLDNLKFRVNGAKSIGAPRSCGKGNHIGKKLPNFLEPAPKNE
jgi:hypothetical protein